MSKLTRPDIAEAQTRVENVLNQISALVQPVKKADPKLVADQLGHTVDVSLNVYAQSPVAGRAVLVNELEMLVQ